MKTNEMLKKRNSEVCRRVYYFIVLSKDCDHIHVFKEDRIVKTINIEEQVKVYGQNAKCVIKHKLFLNHSCIKLLEKL